MAFIMFPIEAGSWTFYDAFLSGEDSQFAVALRYFQL